MNMKLIALFAGLAAVGIWSTGCSSIANIGATIGQATGTITSQQADSLKKTGAALEKTFQDITPEQEYYIGRAVAATVMDKYHPNSADKANEYLNTLGEVLAEASDRPETFGGYHFQILDSDDINAFAAPGGLIMVSKGMLKCCRSEDAVAAVLAHEVGHVQANHGLRAIKKGRLTSALTTLAVEGAKSLGPQQISELTTAFEGSISDITGTMMNSGYARSLERDADAAAVALMKKTGYDPRALVDMLQEMKKNLKPGGMDFAKTHPDPADRIKDIQKLLNAAPSTPAPAARQKRFEKAVAGM
jgi:beta-barrel assembly-enhancing protease